MTETRTSTRFSNYQLATFALFEAGGDVEPIHTEVAAHKAFELCPERFSWTLPQFSSYPDKDLVRVSLTDAEKPEKGALVVSHRSNDGQQFWCLTASGGLLCAEQEKNIRSSLGGTTTQSRRTSHRKLLSRIHASRLWSEYNKDNLTEASDVLLTELLSIPPDSPARVIAENFDVLGAQAGTLRDEAILAFLKEIGDRFSRLLHDGGEIE